MKNILLLIVTAVTVLFFPNVNFGQAPNLGTTSDFALFTAVGAFDNTGASLVTGDVGTNVGAFNAFPPGVLVGAIHVVDAISVQAAIDVDAAYSALSAISCGTVIGVGLGSGQELLPGVYCTGAASTLSGNLILNGNGDPSALFIIKIGGAFSTSTFSTVTLINSASLSNVYWQINGAFDLGDNSVFRGTIVANGAITLLESSSLFGRGLSRGGAISLHNNIVNIGMLPTASTISASGSTTFCEGSSVILSGNIDGTWNNGSTTPSITVNASGDYFVTNTNSCGSISSNHIPVTVNPLPVGSGTIGADTVCQGQSGVIYSVPVIANATDYIWTMPVGATITAGANTNSIIVDFSTTASSGDITVQGSNSCGTGTVSSNFPVTVNPLPIASAISAGGSTTFCEGDSVILSGNNGGVWNNGATTPSITVTTSGDYFVTNTNTCGSDTSNHIPVTVNPNPTSSTLSASGATTFFDGDSVILSGNNGGVWNNGASTASITVTTSGDYFVTNTNACGSITSNHIPVTVNPGLLPIASIILASGPTTFCEGDSVILSGNNGGTWSNGATTSSITVTTSGDYFVTNTNAYGSVTSNHIQVTVNPLPTAAGTIIGTATVCQGQTGVVYSVPAITNATDYIWTLPAGATITAGANTNTITVDFSSIAVSGNITVQGSNDCGAGTISPNYAVTITSLPGAAGTITGSAGCK